MDSVKKESSPRFPEEFPKENKKELTHGVIENVVKSEIAPTSSKNPAKPHNTDSINTEFAKEAMRQGESS